MIIKVNNFIQFSLQQIMSIYNGFATRLQQKKYNQCLQSMLKLITNRLIHFFQHDQYPDNFFKSSLAHLHQTMQHLEVNKYMAPYYSKYLKKLIKEITAQPNNDHVYRDSFFEDKAYQKPIRHFIKINNTVQIEKNHEKPQKHNLLDDGDDFKMMARKISFDFGRNNRSQSQPQEKFHFKSLAHKKTKFEYQIPHNIEQIPQRKYYAKQKREIGMQQERIEAIDPYYQKANDRKEGRSKERRKDRGVYKQKNKQVESPRQFLKNMVLKSEPTIPLGVRTRHKHQKMVQM